MINGFIIWANNINSFMCLGIEGSWQQERKMND